MTTKIDEENIEAFENLMEEIIKYREQTKVYNARLSEAIDVFESKSTESKIIDLNHARVLNKIDSTIFWLQALIGASVVSLVSIWFV